jgi:hypothetical protein
MQELRKPQAEAARRVTWAGKRVSQLAILRELNWMPVDALIWACKIGLHESLKKLPTSAYASTVLAARMRSVQTGRDVRGLCAEVKAIWERLGSPDSWESTTQESKPARKARIKPLMVNAIDEMWEEWCESHGEENGYYHLLCPKVGEAAEHLKNGNKKQIALMITARMGAIICRGNKTNDAKTREDYMCPHCTLREIEDETHILVRCPVYAHLREPMITEVRETMSQDFFLGEFAPTSTNPWRTKLYLLGMEIKGNSKADRVRRDSAVKKFLEEANNYRKEMLGEMDFCGKALVHEEGSAGEAYELAQQAKKAAEEIGEDLL